MQALRELEGTLREFGRAAAQRKLALLGVLAGAELPSAKAVLRLHEALCLLRAHPDDADVRAAVERQLDGFASRRDLRRHRDELLNQGIAGTDIAYPFFAPFARWVDARWGARLTVDWPELADPSRIVAWLEPLVLRAELPALDAAGLRARAWVERLKAPAETDARFLIRSFAALSGTREVRDAAFQSLGLAFVLKAGEGGPSRTTARHAPSPVVYRTRAFRRDRPDLARVVTTPPLAVRDVSPREGRRLIDLACEAMVTRSRDLDSFTFGDPRDVRVVDWGEGLQFAWLGLEPAERLTLEALYGFLMLQNGVPIGYVLASGLLRSSEVAFNVFETFRATEAAWLYGRALATIHQLLGAETFTVYPYQLGHGNDEALASGAWWFYQKLGFRPRDAATTALMETELAAMRRDPRHRSSRTTLKQLARTNLFWSLGPQRDDVIGALPLPEISLAVGDLVRARGSARVAAVRGLRRDARARLGGAADLADWTADERRAFDSWSPLLLLLPGLESWPRRDLRALARVVRAKGGRRETRYLELFDGHARLGDALRALAMGCESLS